MLEQDLVKEKLTEADIEDMMMKTFQVTFGSTMRHVDTPQQEKPTLQAFGFTPETTTTIASAFKAPLPNQRWEDISDLFLTPSKKVRANQDGLRSPEECTVMYNNKSSNAKMFSLSNWSMLLMQAQKEILSGANFIIQILTALQAAPEVNHEVILKLFTNDNIKQYFKGIWIFRNLFDTEQD